MCALANTIKNVPGAGFPDADLPDTLSVDIAGICIAQSVAEITRPKRRPMCARVVRRRARIRSGRNSAASATIDVKMLPVMVAIDEMNSAKETIAGIIVMTVSVLAGEIARTIVDRMNVGETPMKTHGSPVSRSDRVDPLENMKKAGLPG